MRKEGNFKYNITEAGAEKLVVRCKRQGAPRLPEHYVPCPTCKGYYSKLSLRRHYQTCTATSTRGLTANLRKMESNISKLATGLLKDEVFPYMREGNVKDAIRHDQLAILYGNKMCSKYRSQHLRKMIRSRLRLIGRFILEIKNLDPTIKNLMQAIDPRRYDTVVEAIKIVSGFDEKNGNFKAPSTAFSLGSELRKITRIAISESIKNQNNLLRKTSKDFLKLIESDFDTSINKIVEESQLILKRRKNVVLPTNKDISKMASFLNKKKHESCATLEKDGFSFNLWKDLAGYTLIWVQLFNRRRPGEMERVLIDDYKTFSGIDETRDQDVLSTFSEDLKTSAHRYVRFVIRGKLARGVPVLLHKDDVHCIETILKYRNDAKVSNENPYVFGQPGHVNSHLRANDLIRQYAILCGASNPNLLRGTLLRKHIATQSALENLEGTTVEDLATFLGHEPKIHKEYYRLPIATRDIVQMSRILEKAQGENVLHG